MNYTFKYAAQLRQENFFSRTMLLGQGYFICVLLYKRILCGRALFVLLFGSILNC